MLNNMQRARAFPRGALRLASPFSAAATAAAALAVILWLGLPVRVHAQPPSAPAPQPQSQSQVIAEPSYPPPIAEPPSEITYTAPRTPPAAAQPTNNYRIRPKDTVHIKVFQEEDLDTTGRIDKDGNIAFPLLGKAMIGGQTVQEATATMEGLLREYLINPQVSVEIQSYSKQHFTILGQVNKPGTFDMPDEGSVNLLEAIGMAGGYTKIANPSKIIVKRSVDGRETQINIDGKRVLAGKANSVKIDGRTVSSSGSGPIFEVQPGDTIMVGEAIF